MTLVTAELPRQQHLAVGLHHDGIHIGEPAEAAGTEGVIEAAVGVQAHQPVARGAIERIESSACEHLAIGL